MTGVATIGLDSAYRKPVAWGAFADGMPFSTGDTWEPRWGAVSVWAPEIPVLTSPATRVAYESDAFHRAGKDLRLALGVVLGRLIQAGIPPENFHAVRAAQWRKDLGLWVPERAGRKGSCRPEWKAAAVAWCREQGWKPADDDQAEALCIAYWALHYWPASVQGVARFHGGLPAPPAKSRRRSGRNRALRRVRRTR